MVYTIVKTFYNPLGLILMLIKLGLKKLQCNFQIIHAKPPINMYYYILFYCILHYFRFF
jgi:hypothetical protein